MNGHADQLRAIRARIADARDTLETLRKETAEIIGDPLHAGPAPEIVRANEALEKAITQCLQGDQALRQLETTIRGEALPPEVPGH